MFVDVFLYPRWLQVIVQSTGISEDTEIHLLKTLIRHNDTIISNKDPGSYSQYISNQRGHVFFEWLTWTWWGSKGVQWTRWLQAFPNSVESSFQSMLVDSWLVVAPAPVVEYAGKKGGDSHHLTKLNKSPAVVKVRLSSQLLQQGFDFSWGSGGHVIVHPQLKLVASYRLQAMGGLTSSTALPQFTDGLKATSWLESLGMKHGAYAMVL